jgi:transcriptional regulator of NAD metabolism
VLNDTYKRNNFETAHRIAGRIKAVLQIETDMEVDMFLQQLIADYNYLATKE